MDENNGITPNLNKPPLVEQLHDSLQELIGLHSQLLEVVKMESEAITQADVKLTFETTSSKEALVHWIYSAEQTRQVVTYQLGEEQGLNNPSLKEIIVHFQVSNPEVSSQLQTDLSALVLLIERIQKQNTQNGILVEHSLKHVNNMRKTIFGETANENKTYNGQGQKNLAAAGSVGSRLSKEV